MRKCGRPHRDALERYIYDPYGEPTVLDVDSSADSDGVSDNTNEILFYGRRLDPETGLYTCGWKVYHPALGRDLQRGPCGPVKAYEINGAGYCSAAASGSEVAMEWTLDFCEPFRLNPQLDGLIMGWWLLAMVLFVPGGIWLAWSVYRKKRFRQQILPVILAVAGLVQLFPSFAMMQTSEEKILRSNNFQRLAITYLTKGGERGLDEDGYGDRIIISRAVNAYVHFQAPAARRMSEIGKGGISSGY